MTELTLPRSQTGRAAVLAQVKREGPVAADALAAQLGLTPMAVRQHLQALEREGLVAQQEADRKAARGRPARVWRTTAAGDRRFADAHAGLTVDLIRQMRAAFGEEGLDRLLALRTAEQAAAYGAEVGAYGDLRGRLQALAAIREREGYMAELREDEGGFLLLEHHCPVCAAASICTGLCREELALFGRVLGEGVKVERTAHLLAGAGRCAYRITDALASPT
ncbi:MAG TPA: metalloregulator ArsR/SmtB family transcription factor [Caulobacteraceae bacterium]|jgi:predicted ArsR family transcriptional regulator|nr:metalloregulator ArsR/SmtB family transcription factor [Caulobacteraceae bacterium]